MSLSREATSAAEQPPRQLKCSRCRHHGIIVPVRGHAKVCPFLKCECWKCFLIAQRTRITTLQRNLKKDQNKEQRPGADKPAAEGTCTAILAADGGASRDGTLERAATSGRRRPAAGGDSAAGGNTTAGGDSAAGSGSFKVLLMASREEGPCSPFNAPHSGPPLPAVHFPFRMSGHRSSSFAPCPNLLFNVPWFPAVPAPLYSNGLCGPQMFPHFQPGPPAPPPLPELPQEEMTSRQHPQPPRFGQLD